MGIADLPRRVRVVEVGPRDGLQNEGGCPCEREMESHDAGKSYTPAHHGCWDGALDPCGVGHGAPSRPKRNACRTVR